MIRKTQFVRLMLIANIVHFCHGSCVLPWIQPGNDSPCYAVSTEELNFYNADKFCKTHGGFLAEPRTQEETNLIELFVKPDKNYWIGLTDIGEEGAFVWGSDFSAPDYTNWYPGQPDDYYDNEDCVNLHSIFGLQWDDDICSTSSWDSIGYHALCQKPS